MSGATWKTARAAERRARTAVRLVLQASCQDLATYILEDGIEESPGTFGALARALGGPFILIVL